jgi:hypothetical protein
MPDHFVSGKIHWVPVDRVDLWQEPDYSVGGFMLEAAAGGRRRSAPTRLDLVEWSVECKQPDAVAFCGACK